MGKLWAYLQIRTSLKKFGRVKRSSLFFPTVNDREKKFNKTFPPSVNVTKLFFFVIKGERKQVTVLVYNCFFQASLIFEGKEMSIPESETT